MKTQKSLPAGIFLLGPTICARSLSAQSWATVEPRPKQRDAASSQLLTNRDLDGVSFLMPTTAALPTLPQRPVSRN